MLEKLVKRLVRIQSPKHKVVWYTMIDDKALYCVCENYEIHKSLNLLIVDLGENVSVQECSSEYMVGTVIHPLESDSNMQAAILDTVIQYLKMMPQIGEDI